MQLSSNRVMRAGNQKASLSLTVLTVLCVGASPYAVTAVYVLDRTRPFCVIGQNISFWQHLYFLRTVIKTREWAGVLPLKPLSLLFYYYSPRRPQLRPAISLKPVRVSATRMDRLMGGRRCLRERRVCVCVRLCVRVYIYVCAFTYIRKAKVAFMLHVFWISGDTLETSGRLLNEIRQILSRAESMCVIGQTENGKGFFFDCRIGPRLSGPPFVTLWGNKERFSTSTCLAWLCFHCSLIAAQLGLSYHSMACQTQPVGCPARLEAKQSTSMNETTGQTYWLVLVVASWKHPQSGPSPEGASGNTVKDFS